MKKSLKKRCIWTKDKKSKKSEEKRRERKRGHDSGPPRNEEMKRVIGRQA